MGKAVNGGTQTCGKITFGTETVATAGAYSIGTGNGTYTYGGLTLAISVPTWTLTPVAP
jgi:hypothetical protein